MITIPGGADIRDVEKRDHGLVCVAEGSAEPVLCSLVRDMLAQRFGRVMLVANRVRESEPWAGLCEILIAESRLTAPAVKTPSSAVG